MRAAEETETPSRGGGGVAVTAAAEGALDDVITDEIGPGRLATWTMPRERAGRTTRNETTTTKNKTGRGRRVGYSTRPREENNGKREENRRKRARHANLSGGNRTAPGAHATMQHHPGTVCDCFGPPVSTESRPKRRGMMWSASHSKTPNESERTTGTVRLEDYDATSVHRSPRKQVFFSFFFAVTRGSNLKQVVDACQRISLQLEGKRFKCAH